MIARGLIAAVLLCAGCGVATRVETLGPDFDGTRTVRMRGNVLPTPLNGMAAIELNVERTDVRDQPPAFALLVEVHAEGLRIRSGESLRLVLDGDTLAFARDDAIRSWPRTDPTVREQARYASSDSVLLRLASAEEVRLNLRGAAWTEHRRLSEANRAAIREFVAEHVGSGED